MKQWYTADELAGLEGMPSSARRVRSKADNENWERQARAFGKGYEFHLACLPEVAQQALYERHKLSLLKRMSLASTSLREKNTRLTGAQQTTEQQRIAASARSMVLSSIEGMVSAGVSKEAAIHFILTQAELGTLGHSNPVLEKALSDSVDRRGKGDDGRHYPSARTIKRWFRDVSQDKALVPSVRQKAPLPEWLGLFRRFYNVPEKPSLNSAYDDFVEAWTRPEQPPSVYAVRRAMNKLGNVEREKGRMGVLELSNIKAFTRRSFDKLLPCDVYSADGHTFDGEVAHPLHGRPFRPEITTFIDIATRRVVGVSVTLAESGLAVLDALMDACKCGVPALLYVDNGSGYINDMLKDESKGVLARLGTEMTHSLPYNSKARGVIERVHQTLWVAGAKKLPNYVGKDMDRQARLMNYKQTRSAMNNDGALELLSWQDFMAWVQDRVTWYNQRPHSSLPKTGAQGARRHESPLEAWNRFSATAWEPETLSGAEIAHIFRPQEERTVLRGEVRLFNNRYFAQALEEWHGAAVHVAYDIHDANRVWVFEIGTGRFITQAEFAANESDYFPQTMLERAREKRAQGRLNRALKKVEEIEAERTGNPVIEQQSFVLEGFNDLEGNRTMRSDTRQTLVIDAEPSQASTPYERLEPAERYQLYQQCQARSDLEQEHESWLRSYPKSKEFKYFQAQH